MGFFSFKTLWLAVLAFACYWFYVGWQKLENKRKHEEFILDQRRKAGISDLDKRPFGVARSDAVKSRQQKVLREFMENLKREHEENLRNKLVTSATTSSLSAFHQHQTRSKLAAKLSGIPGAQPGYLRNRTFPSPPQPNPEPRWPGGYYDLPEYNPSPVNPNNVVTPLSSYTSRQNESYPSSPHTYKHTPSQAYSPDLSELSTFVKRRNIHSSPAADAFPFNRKSRKRDPAEARDGTNDSVIGDREGIAKRRSNLRQEIPSHDDISLDSIRDDDDDDDQEMEYVDYPPVLPVKRRNKRHADELDGAESIAAPSSRIVRTNKKGKAQGSVSDTISADNHSYQLQDEEMASLSEFNPERIESDRDSLSLARKSKGKRKADTSNDREPGEEWVDLNGLRWKIGQDGIRRRATVVVEMRPKYRMPRDSLHPDAKEKIQVYVERFLSEEEWEEAKRKKLLGFQEAERQRDAEAKLKEQQEAILAVAQARNTSTPKRLKDSNLLYSDRRVFPPPPKPQSLLQSNPSLATPPRANYSPMRDETPGTADRARAGRISLSAASASPRATPSRRAALDEESKKRREELLMKKLREKLQAEKNSNAMPSNKATSVAVAPSSSESALASLVPESTAKASKPSIFMTAPNNNFFAGLGSSTATFDKAKDADSAKSSSKPSTLTDTVQSTAPFPLKKDDGNSKASAAQVKSSSSIPSFSFGTAPTLSKPEAKPITKETKPSFSFGKPASFSSSEPVSKSQSTSEVSASTPTANSFSKPSFSFGTGSETKTSTAPDPTLKAKESNKFGFGAPSVSSSTPLPSSSLGTKPSSTLGGFSFGSTSSKPDASADSNEGKKTMPSFSFGSTLPSKPAAASGTSSGTVGFGFDSSAAGSESKPKDTLASSTTSTSNAAFSFGVPKQSDEKAKSSPLTGGLSFGAPSGDTKQEEAKATPPPFSFGATSSTASAPLFSLGSTSSSTAPKAGSSAPSFSFGSTPNAAPSFSFGSATVDSAKPTPASTKPSFVFGVAPSSSSSSTLGSSSTFTFGPTSSSATSSSNSDTTKPTTGSFGFGSNPSQSTTNQTGGTFTFGTTSKPGGS